MSTLEPFDLPEPINIGDHGEISYLLSFLSDHIEKIATNKTSVQETRLNLRLAREHLDEIWPQLSQQHENNKF
tara:strand:+ start:2051 stop:2269 length:219 start_codon:yes stop_codon:yes gene_type:complete